MEIILPIITLILLLSSLGHSRLDRQILINSGYINSLASVWFFHIYSGVSCLIRLPDKIDPIEIEDAEEKKKSDKEGMDS